MKRFVTAVLAIVLATSALAYLVTEAPSPGDHRWWAMLSPVSGAQAEPIEVPRPVSSEPELLSAPKGGPAAMAQPSPAARSSRRGFGASAESSETTTPPTFAEIPGPLSASHGPVIPAELSEVPKAPPLPSTAPKRPGAPRYAGQAVYPEASANVAPSNAIPSSSAPLKPAFPVNQTSGGQPVSPASEASPLDAQPAEATLHPFDMPQRESTAPGPFAQVSPAALRPATSAILSAGGTGEGMALRWLVPSIINQGQETPCQLVIQNCGSEPALAVSVVVQLPKEFQCGRCRPEAEVEGRSLAWRLGTIDPGFETILNLSLTAVATGDSQPVASVTCTRATTASLKILKPQLELGIDGPRDATFGQTTNYQFTVTNKGEAPTTQVFVETKLPENVRHPLREGGRLRYSVGTLGPGESRRVAVPLVALEPGSYSIGAIAGLGDAPLSESEFTAQWQRPTFKLQVDGPKMRFVDRKATYTITVENPSPTAIENIQVLEIVPDSFRFVEATAGGNFDAATRQVSWHVGRLEPQQSTTVGVHLIPTEVGEHHIEVVANADGGIESKAKGTTRVEGVSCVVLDVSETDDPIEVRGETWYTLQLSNQGSQPSRGVQIAATVPDEMKVLDTRGPTKGAVDGQSVIFEPLAELTPGKTEIYQVRVRCNAVGQVRFRAFFRSEDTPTPVVEEESTRVYAD